jgi:hypothetical protein
LPNSIKLAALSLVVSLFSSLAAVYLDGLVYEELSFGNPLILGTNALWSLVIIWLMWDLIHKKNIRLPLIFIGLIMLFFIVWDIIDYGFELVRWLYILELVFILVAYACLQSPESRIWLAEENV